MIYRFGRFELDLERYELRVDGRPQPLAPKGFRLLQHLLEQAPRVVPKEELYREIWRGEHVTPSVLPVSIRAIRAALGESGEGEVLRTVRGRGYRIVGEVQQVEPPASADGETAARPPFIGRQRLLSSLRADCACAAAGQGRFVLLTGEPGVGKTRVLEELARVLRRQRHTLLVPMRCSEDPGAPPFWPIQRLVEAAAEPLHGRQLRSSFEQSGVPLRRLAARLLRALREHGRGNATPEARFELVQRASELLTAASEVAPVVLLIDDLHNADEATLAALEAVARDLRGKAVFVVATCTDPSLRRGTALARMIGGISRQEGFATVRLRGFERDEIAAWVRLHLGPADDPRLLRELAERTQGNPFFLREVLRLVQDVSAGPPRADFAAIGLPLTIRDTLAQRIRQLSPGCQDLLTWASVIGQRFWFPLLERVAGVEPGHLLVLLSEAEQAQVLSSAPLAPPPRLGEYAFSHALLRETLYDTLSGAERVMRHRAVGEALENLPGAAGPERVFELARHFAEAAPGGNLDRAVDYCVRAGYEATARYAFEEAVRFFERARHCEELRSPHDDLRHCCIRMATARALWRAGRYPEATGEFSRAADQARTLGRFDLLGYCALGLGGWPRLNRLSAPGGSGHAELTRIAALAREALHGLPEDEEVLRTRLLGLIVRANRRLRSPAERPPAELEGSDALLDRACEVGGTRSRLRAQRAKLETLMGPHQLDAALELASRTVELARRLPEPTPAFAAYESRIPLLLALGDMRGVDADIAAAGAIARRVRVPAYTYSIQRFRLARALGDGDFERARELSRRVALLGRESGDDGAGWASSFVGLFMLGAQGRGAEIGQPLESLSREGRAGGRSAAIAAYFAMLAGDRIRCAEALDHAAADGFAAIPMGASWLWHMCACADAASYLGDPRYAERLHALIEPFAHLNVTVRLHCYRGSASTSLARLAVLLDRRDEAEERFEAALAFNARIGARPALVWAQQLYARMLLRGAHTERRRARALLRDAERGAQELGLPLPPRSRRRRTRPGRPPLGGPAD